MLGKQKAISFVRSDMHVTCSLNIIDMATAKSVASGLELVAFELRNGLFMLVQIGYKSSSYQTSPF